MRRPEDVWRLLRWEKGAHGEPVAADGSLASVSHRVASARGAEPCWLRLPLVEAFHLAFVQRRLRVVTGSEEGAAGCGCAGGSFGDAADAAPAVASTALDEAECWRRFCETSARFPYEYAAYCHLFADGWLVRSGHLFGADFALYPPGPRLEHASHLVIVRVEGEPERPWLALQGHVRLSQQVAKRLVLCHVGMRDADPARPETPPEARWRLGSAACLQALRVSPIEIHAWSPGRAHGEESCAMRGTA